LRTQSTKYEPFEVILISNDFTNNMKTFEKLIEFENSFTKNGFYSKIFGKPKKLGRGSFGTVFKVKIKEDSDQYLERGIEYSALKRIEFISVDKNAIIREYKSISILYLCKKLRYPLTIGSVGRLRKRVCFLDTLRATPTILSI
jgi:hypothetical protein